MPGILHIVGTPIGNLGDMSPRAIKILRTVDFIAAEDTRVSLKLMRHFGIDTPLVSYHEHNRRERGEMLIARLAAGETGAVITDAGMPCISDPGEDLVRMAAGQNIPVVVVPGPSAAISALALSGLPAGRFAFEGFLSINKTARFAHLEAVKDDPRTLIFYEAPHKLIATLRDMFAVFGERRIALARELTKLHEEVIRATFSEALAFYEEKSPRGEYVLIVEGAPPAERETIPLEEAVRLARVYIERGDSVSQAAKTAAKETGHKKADIYRALI
jgi:16S rRNA (cytidine1402-2'-O)-methyltransferase